MRRYFFIFLLITAFSCSDNKKTVVIIPEEEKTKAKMDSLMGEFDKMRGQFKERINQTDSANKLLRQSEKK